MTWYQAPLQELAVQRDDWRGQVASLDPRWEGAQRRLESDLQGCLGRVEHAFHLLNNRLRDDLREGVEKADLRKAKEVTELEACRTSCGGQVEPIGGGLPARCPAAVVAAGIYFMHERPASACWAFACPTHAGVLIAARSLLARDREEIDRRRRVQAGGEPVSATLAVGVAARNFASQARGWADRNPDRLYRPSAP